MTVWVRRPGTLWRRIDGGVMVLAPGDEEPLVLHGAAASVWDLLDRPADLDGLLARASTTGAAAHVDDLGAVLAGAVALLADRSLITDAADAGAVP